MQKEAPKSPSAVIDRAARTFAYCALIVWAGALIVAISLFGWVGFGSVLIASGLTLALMHWDTLKRRAQK